MTFPHPDNPKVEVRLPLFIGDRSQIYQALYNKRTATFINNQSLFFPVIGNTYDIFNGVSLFPQANFYDFAWCKNYADILFTKISHYSGTDYYYPLNHSLPVEKNKFHNPLIFPLDFNINEPTLPYLELTIPITQKEENITISFLRRFDYRNTKIQGTGISYYYNLEYIKTKSSTVEVKKIRIYWLDSFHNQMKDFLQVRKEEKSPIVYGSVNIDTDTDENLKRQLENQFDGDLSYFLYPKLESFLEVVFAHVEARFGNDLFMLPARSNCKTLYAYKILPLTFSEFQDEDTATRRNNFKNELINTLLLQGCHLSYRTTLEEDSDYYFFQQGSLADIEPYSYLCIGYIKSPPVFQSIDWVYRPNWYKESRLIKAFPVGDSLKSFRDDQDLSNTYYLENQAFFFPPARTNKLYLTKQTYQPKHLGYEIGTYVILRVVGNHPELPLSPNLVPERIPIPHLSEALFINVETKVYPLDPFIVSWNGLAGSTQGNIFTAISSSVKRIDVFSLHRIRIILTSYNCDSILKDENYFSSDLFYFSSQISDEEIFFKEYYFGEIIEEENGFGHKAYRLDFNIFPLYPTEAQEPFLQTELEVLNYWKTKNMINSQELLEVHQALSADKFSVYVDKDGNLTPRKWNLGEMTARLAEWLGLYFNPDYTIKQVEQSKNWDFDKKGKINIDKEGYPIGQAGIHVDLAKNKEHLANIYVNRGNTFDSNQITATTNFITNPESALRHGSFKGVHNIIQYFEMHFADLFKVLGQEASAWVLPNANPISIKDEKGKKKELYSVGEGLTTMLGEIIYMLSSFSKQLTETSQTCLQLKAEMREIYKCIGAAATTKTIPIQVDQKTGYGLPFAAKPEDAPSISDQLQWILMNIGSIQASSAIEVSKLYDYEELVENLELGNKRITYPQNPAEKEVSFIDFGDGNIVYIDPWEK